MNIQLIPFRSGLRASEAQQHLTERFASELGAHSGWNVAVTLPEDASAALMEPGAMPVILSLSGGIEEQVLRTMEPWRGAMVILAHGHANSLPASLEILARYRQLGRPGRIVFASQGYIDELERVLSLAQVQSWMSSSRIGVIGDPSGWLIASMPDANRVRESWGPTVVRLETRELVEAYGRVDSTMAKSFAREFSASACGCNEPRGVDIENAARIYGALIEIAQKHRLNGLTVRCFDLLGTPGTTGCLALARLNEEGVPASCEGDVPALLTMMLLHRLGQTPSFMANPAEMDPAGGWMTLAHCTVPRSIVRRYAIRSHFESGIGVAIQGEFEDGPCTIARIGGTDLKSLFVAEGIMSPAKSNENLCRTQVRISMDGASIRGMLERPLGNHHILAPGHLGALVEEYWRMFVAENRHFTTEAQRHGGSQRS